MKRIAILLSLLVFFCCTENWANGAEVDFNWSKKWETSIGVGFKGFTKSEIEDAGMVILKAQKRIGYPLLLGMEGEAALAGNIAYFRVGVPFTYRLRGFGDKSKIDLTVVPGVSYATNLDTDVNQLGATGGIGAEFKYFYRTGYAIGLGAYYTLTTNDLDNFSIMLILSF
jgi:hypothetical protein